MITQVEVLDQRGDHFLSGVLRWNGLLHFFRFAPHETIDAGAGRLFRLTPLELQWRSPTVPQFVSEDDLRAAREETT